MELGSIATTCLIVGGILGLHSSVLFAWLVTHTAALLNEAVPILERQQFLWSYALPAIFEAEIQFFYLLFLLQKVSNIQVAFVVRCLVRMSDSHFVVCKTCIYFVVSFYQLDLGVQIRKAPHQILVFARVYAGFLTRLNWLLCGCSDWVECLIVDMFMIRV